MLPNILNIKYRGSLCYRCILTLVRFQRTQRITGILSFPSISDWQMDKGIFNSPVLARTHWDFAAVLQTDLTRSLVPSVTQANIKGVGLVLH